MKITGAIFDMDGTLLDSMYVWNGIGTRYALSRGITPKDDFEQKLKKMSLVEATEYLKSEFSFDSSPQEMIDGLNALAEPVYRNEVTPKPGIIDFLEGLKRRGVKMCVATATDIHLAEMVLEKLDMRKYFSAIFTCSMVGAGKDKPTVYEAALELLGTPKSETPVFEDALYAIKTAKAAGFPIVGVYEDTFKDHQQEIKRLSDAYVEHYGAGIVL